MVYFLSFVIKKGMGTQPQLGPSVSNKVISRNRAAIANQNFQVSNDAIQEAIDKEFTLLLMIDDYHNIHTIRRPQQENRAYRVDKMCTIIIKIIVKEVPAIPFSSVNLTHNPHGIDANLLVNKLCSIQFFSQICTSSFACSMSEFTSFSFDPVMGRHQMESHDYQGASSLRSFKDVYLIDFVKLPLKSKKNYEDAFEKSFKR